MIILINGKMGKKEMTFQRENAFISSLIIDTNKWQNRGKEEMSLERKCKWSRVTST